MKYRTIVADPPWPIADPRTRLVWAGTGGRRRRSTSIGYDLMSLDDIKALSVGDWAEPDAHLYLWVTAGFNRQGVGVAVAEAWGFTVVGEIVWAKPSFGMGRFPRPQHEILLVCRRGNLQFQIADAGSVQWWSQKRAHGNGGKIHSAKPDGAQDLIERASPGPYLDVFSRQQRMGWDSWGNEAYSPAHLPPAVSV